MQKIANLELYPDYRIFRVHNANLDYEYTEHYVTDQTFSQGFSGFPGSYDFYTLGACMGLQIEVWLAERQESIALKPETVRAIAVPFPSDGFGVKISDIQLVNECLLQISKEQYGLVFEIKLRDDKEYLNSERYQEDIDGSFTQESCCLTFYSREEVVQPEILRNDVWSTPPYSIAGYYPLNPTYPLFLEAREPEEPTFSIGEAVDLNRSGGDGDQVVPDASEAALNRERLLNELENSEESSAMRKSYEQGLLLSDQGNYQQAISELTRTINSYPDYAEAYLARGIAYNLQGNRQEFINDYEQAVLAYQRRGEFDKVEYYQSLVDALRAQ
jgi:tetratricopeptide (TPR) repeat protein